MPAFSAAHRPALRPLARAIVFGLMATTTAPLLARTLDNEDLTIQHDHAPEAWLLRNGATLEVLGAQTHDIIVNDTSRVTLDNATVTRQAATMSAYAMAVLDNATAIARNTRFAAGGLWVAGDARAELVGSSITVAADAPGLGDNSRTAWGLSLNNNNPGAPGIPRVLLDASSITVADRADQSHYSSGIGAYMRAGELTLRNGSSVDAANVGVIVHSSKTADHAVKLHLDNSRISAGRGAAIEVAAQNDAANTVDIMIANGSALDSGNGTLLRVHAYGDTATSGYTDVNVTVDDSRLQGDIHFDDTWMQGRVDVVLRNLAAVSGRFINVSSASVSTGSTWTLTGDSSVGHLDLLAGGTVALGPADSGRFNTLSVDSFNGAGGTLVFNTVLGDDRSDTDRLVIAGDASGQAFVQVNNAGGRGAQTVDGIELINIGGQSGAQFDLVGRAVGGQYEYFLFKGEDGHWYLRSELPEEPGQDPCKDDPSQCDVTLPVEDGIVIDPIDEVTLPVEDGIIVDPPTPQPVLRPETGAYLATHAAMTQLLNYRAADRVHARGDADGVRTWASAERTETRMGSVGHQRLRTDSTRLQFGADIGVFDGGNGRIGALLSAGQADTVSRSTVTGYRANGQVEGGSAGLYAGWSNGRTFVDAALQHGRFRHSVQGEGLVQERYKASASQLSMEAGHRFEVGHIGNTVWSLQPEAQISYTRTAMASRVESNGTVIEQTRSNQVSSRVGVRVQGDSHPGAVQWQPYLSVHAVHNGAAPSMSFDGEVIGGGTPHRQWQVGAGTQVQFRNGLSVKAGLDVARGSDDYRAVGAQLSVAYRW